MRGTYSLLRVFFLLCLFTLNILRERFRYGDYAYYIEAATALLNHQTLPDTYLYLPFGQQCCNSLSRLEIRAFWPSCGPSICLRLECFYFLLIRVLERYQFSNRLAVIVAVLFILINAPIQRTLGFVQVNLLVMDLIFLSILAYPKKHASLRFDPCSCHPFEDLPAVLVLAFLLELNWRWLAWFALSFLVIAAIPVAINGISPYYDYLNNIAILTHIPDTNFHDTSFDSFLRFLNPFLGINILWTRIMIYTAKAALLFATITVMLKNLRNQSFVIGENKMLNALPPLFVFMTLASPIVWDHHGIFVTLSFLLMLKRMEAPAMWIWFGFAYFLEFVLPLLTFFPGLMGRLIAPMIVLGLMWLPLPKKHEVSRFFTNGQSVACKTGGLGKHVRI